MAKRSVSRNPADRVMRAQLREPLHFPDLSERRALKLSAVTHYAARVHFGLWHRHMGRPDFEQFSGVFTPLYYVEIEVADRPLEPMTRLTVRGETFLAKTLDAAGEIDHLIREGNHAIRTETTTVARARLINVFTRYDQDPARRRVRELPPELGLGPCPDRVADLPEVDDLVPGGRAADVVESEPSAWHYGQTDPNRHVNGMEYLRQMECFAATALERRGHDLGRLYFARARLLYRKPCFRGERYRRALWLHGEDAPTATGVFYKESDFERRRPAVVVDLTLAENVPL